jgi:hypothetical protein
MKTTVWALMVVAILGGAACATSPGAPPSVDVTGNWSGTWFFEPSSVGNGMVSARLTQEGSRVTGELTVSGPARTRPSRFEGIVSGDDIRIVGSDATGWLKVKGDEMTGQVNGVLPAMVTMKRVR